MVAASTAEDAVPLGSPLRVSPDERERRRAAAARVASLREQLGDALAAAEGFEADCAAIRARVASQEDTAAELHEESAVCHVNLAFADGEENSLDLRLARLWPQCEALEQQRSALEAAAAARRAKVEGCSKAKAAAAWLKSRAAEVAARAERGLAERSALRRRCDALAERNDQLRSALTAAQARLSGGSCSSQAEAAPTPRAPAKDFDHAETRQRLEACQKELRGDVVQLMVIRSRLRDLPTAFEAAASGGDGRVVARAGQPGRVAARAPALSEFVDGSVGPLLRDFVAAMPPEHSDSARLLEARLADALTGVVGAGGERQAAAEAVGAAAAAASTATAASVHVGGQPGAAS